MLKSDVNLVGTIRDHAVSHANDLFLSPCSLLYKHPSLDWHKSDQGRPPYPR